MGSCFCPSTIGSSPSTIGSPDFKQTFIHLITMELYVSSSPLVPFGILQEIEIFTFPPLVDRALENGFLDFKPTCIRLITMKLSMSLLVFPHRCIFFPRIGEIHLASLRQSYSRNWFSDFKPTCNLLITMKGALCLLVLPYMLLLEFSINSKKITPPSPVNLTFKIGSPYFNQLAFMWSR